MNSKSLKIRIKISIQPWMKIIFLIVAYYIGQQNAYKEKYTPDEVIMPKVRDLTADGHNRRRAVFSGTRLSERGQTNP